MSTHPVAAAVLDHFDRHRRDLPWRRTADPYAIWVSEVMLQQTRVDTVRDYYHRWLDRFPTVHVLARAEIDEVLLAWKGLGYYSRARNLHAAARVVRERHGGDLPADPAALRALPGVGEYTAGAVASIAYGVAIPAVDGNVRRVLSRLYDLPAPGPATLRGLAAALLPADRPGDFNQALMELGATICTPKRPACDACPIADRCVARDLGTQEQRPLPMKRAPVPERTVDVAVVLAGGDHTLLVRRPETGLLAGMWEFPVPADHAWVRELADAADPVAELEAVVHVFTHLKVTYVPTVYALAIPARPGDGPTLPPTPASARMGFRFRPRRLRPSRCPAADRPVRDDRVANGVLHALDPRERDAVIGRAPGSRALAAL